MKRNIFSILLSVIYLTGIGGFFWTQSRYPQLEGKAGSGVATDIPDFLSFDLLFDHVTGETWFHEVLIALINWSYTNWKGMVFGILFGVGVLTLFHFINISRFPKNIFLLSFIGFINGCGLGVCANCSTPIGKSIISSGVHPIVGISTIISSPSFNVIGIGLLFSIFPWYIALGKIVFYVCIIFGVVPIIFKKEYSKDDTYNICSIPEKQSSIQKELVYFLKIFIKSLSFIVIKTVPLMILGGLIGVSIMSLVSENLVNGLEVNTLSIFVVSIITFLLPVPIFFDIIFSGIAYNSSVPNIFAIILLLNLGGFSIYPLLLLAQDIKVKRLLIFCSIFITLSVLFSYFLDSISRNHNLEKIKTTVSLDFYKTGQRYYKYQNTINSLSEKEMSNIFSGIHSVNPLPSEKEFKTLAFKNTNIDDIQLSSFKFLEKQKKGKFTPLYGEELGINANGYRLSLMFSGVGITDYNNDKWEDIILASANGLNIYKNIGGQFISDNTIELGNIINTAEISQANFYDLDGDLFKDLIVITRSHGIYILWNNKGDISINDSFNIDVTNDENYSYGISVGDVFDDENLDIFVGEYSAINRRNGLRNFILKNNGNRDFEILWMQEKIIGATLTSLIWDFDNDGKQEIFEGNDFSFASDIIYNVGEDTKIDFHSAALDIIPTTTYSNMGITMGDINGDLQSEFFISGNEKYDNNIDLGDINSSSCIYPSSSNKDVLDNKQLHCETKELVLISAIRKECNILKNSHLQNLCNTLIKVTSGDSHNGPKEKEDFCKSIKDSFHFSSLYNYCKQNKKMILKTENYTQNQIPQVDNNVLIGRDKNGILANVIENIPGLSTGWSWAAFFGDIDNNGYEDLYVGNGHIRNNRARESNKLLLNNGTELLGQEEEMGIENYLDTVSSAYIDFDNDGDLDIINVSIFGDFILFKNDLNTQNSVIFDIIDTQKNNTEAIGSQIIITTKDGNQQIKNLYVGGHFISLQNTQAHFGLGKQDIISDIEIIWNDNSSTTINGPFFANHKYTITR